MGKKIYSYHTFILPFVWECKGNEQKKFIQYLNSNPNWTHTNMKDPYKINSADYLSMNNDYLLLFKEYQYFHTYARNAVYGFGDEIVENYSFLYDSLHEKAHYYIQKGDEEYDLLINAINLKVYATGIALFSIECENHGLSKNGHRQDDMASVKAINEYGRRIALPYIADDYLCADLLTVHISDECEFKSDFKAFVDEVNKDKNRISLTHVADFVKEILGYDGNIKFTSRNDNLKSNEIYIYPMMGDRMYVMCYVEDALYASCAKQLYEECICKKSVANPHQKKWMKLLYELVFVDKDDGCTCQDNTLILDELENAIYSRWIDYGTMYSITNYSFIMLAKEEKDYLIESFLSIYYQMYLLVIMQRVSLAKFKREVSALSKGFEKRGRTIRKAEITRIMDLQERFVAFEAQLCFDEVSPEQQGIELYNLLQKKELIQTEKESVKGQLQSLYDVANTSIGFKLNKVMLIFTWIAAFVSIGSMLLTTLQISKNNINSDPNIAVLDGMLRNIHSEWVVAGIIIIVAICILISLLLINFSYRRRK